MIKNSSQQTPIWFRIRLLIKDFFPLREIFDLTFKLGSPVCHYLLKLFLLDHFLNASLALFAYQAFIGCTRKYHYKNIGHRQIFDSIVLLGNFVHTRHIKRPDFVYSVCNSFELRKISFQINRFCV